ncbi:Legumain [Halotydeus destructor]|nr:Legumain [Halotydeus destructor]
MNSVLATVALALVTVAHGSPAHFGNVVQSDPSFTGKQWALLIAGSRMYHNYRHQADVYHAYQVLTAYNKANPVKGNVINRPSGPDVYTGVPKDYVGNDVTLDNALKARRGDKGLESQGKEVIKSTDKDHIFIYFADHGGPGVVEFLYDGLQAVDVNDALIQLHQDKKYGKLVIL